MMALELALGVLAAGVLVPAGVLLLEIAAACLRPKSPPEHNGLRPAVAVVIPAHDEARVIADTIRAVQAQLRSGDRLVVIADNCSDDTAQIARDCGAEALERIEPARRGKGYALEFAIGELAHQPPEVLLVLDADCMLAAGALDALAREAQALERPVQALYLMRSPPGGGAAARLAEFAWCLRSVVRALGLQRLGLPCQLAGSGMAFPWTVVKRLRLQRESIVEDLALGLEAARLGVGAAFCPRALVTSSFPPARRAQAQQRTRWEHGHLATITQHLPRLLYEAVRRRNGQLAALLLDVSVPPLALLCIVVTLLLAASIALYAFTGALWPAAISASALAMIAAAVMAAWIRFGRRIVSWLDLGYSAVYALAKLPLYARFITRRQTQWIRTERGGP